MRSPASPLITVIIPVFNGADFIAAAINSIDRQTYRSIEIIVVDDGSTDATASVVKGLHPRFPLRYEYQANRGVAAARNQGLALASGSWVAFLDADDFWQPEKIELQCRLAEDHPLAGLIFSNAERIDEQSQRLPDFFSITSPRAGRVTKDLLHQNFVPLLTVIAKTDLVRQAGGFDANLTTSEDYDLWLRLSRLTEFAFVPDSLATYRVRTSSASADQRRLLDSDIAVLKKFINLFPGEASAMMGIIANHLHLHLIVYSLIDVIASRRIMRDLRGRNVRHWKLTYVYLASWLPRPMMIFFLRAGRIERERRTHA